MLLPSGYSTTDYSIRADRKGWGLGWRSGQSCPASVDLVTVVTRNGARLPMRRAVAELVDTLIEVTEARGYLAVNGWCWGFSCRAIAGTNTASNHSWGLAFDLNAPKNPYNSLGVHDIPSSVYALFRAYGFGVGADYNGSKDYMHFEFMGTPGDADIMTQAARRAFILNENTSPPVTPAPQPVPVPTPSSTMEAYRSGVNAGSRVIQLNSAGDDVKTFQKVASAWYPKASTIPDGYFGRGTTALAQVVQKNNNLTVDGVVGPKTWAALKIGSSIQASEPAAPVVAPAAAPAYPGTVLQLGSKGASVQQMQERLKLHTDRSGFGFDYSSGPGIYGPRTQAAVIWYQTARHGAPFHLAIDGKVGPATWASLWQ